MRGWGTADGGTNLTGVGDVRVCCGEGEGQVGKVTVIVAHEHKVAVQLGVKRDQVVHIRMGIAHLLQEETCQRQLDQHTLHSAAPLSMCNNTCSSACCCLYMHE